MKALLFFLLLIGLNASGIEPDAGAGSSHAIALAADDIAPALGLEARAFDFTFEKPVYCKMSFLVGSPGETAPKITSCNSSGAGKTIRISYCFMKPDEVAKALGLAPEKSAQSKCRCLMITGERALQSSFTASWPNRPIEEGESYSGVPQPPPQFSLDKEVVVFGSAGPMAKGGADPQTAADFKSHARYVLVTVIFSEKPIK